MEWTDRQSVASNKRWTTTRRLTKDRLQTLTLLLLLPPPPPPPLRTM